MSGPPTAITHGLWGTACGVRCNLRGMPLGAVGADADPAHDVAQLSVSVDEGPGGEPLGTPSRTHEEGSLVLDLEHVPASQFADLRELIEAHDGGPIKYSPLGSTTYRDEEWMLVSTTAGWVETSHGRWAGQVALWRRGAEV